MTWAIIIGLGLFVAVLCLVIVMCDQDDGDFPSDWDDLAGA